LKKWDHIKAQREKTNEKFHFVEGGGGGIGNNMAAYT
jgi:hypothetical protein